MRRWMTLCVVAALALLVAAGARPQPALAVRSACGWQKQPPRIYKHVIIIMHENHSFEHIMGNRHAPFLNGIARRCGMATNSWATAHLSYFDYSAATSGLNYRRARVRRSSARCGPAACAGACTRNPSPATA